MSYPVYPVEGTPYSNFHDLNLDWILQRVKEAYEAYKNLPDTVDQSVRAYMESDSFLDALRDIIDEEFLTEAAEQAIKERLTTINVRDYGATGDGSDQSSQIAEAVTAFINDPDKDTILFPAGTYKFNTQTIRNKPVTVLGDHSVFTPIRIIENQDPFYTMFTFDHCPTATIQGIEVTGYTALPTAPPIPASEREPMRPCFLFYWCDESKILDCHFHDFNVSWYKSYTLDILMPDRCGMLFKSYGTGHTLMRDCDVYGDIGGEELILIATPYNVQDVDFAQGSCTITNNRFHDRPTTIRRGASTSLNVYGGTAVFTDNIYDNWSYTWYSSASQRMTAGSITNFMANNALITNNQVVNCTGGDFVDTTENGLYICESVVFKGNNITGGNMQGGIVFDAMIAEITDNHIEATGPLGMYISNGSHTADGVTRPSHYSANINPAEKRVRINISNNYILQKYTPSNELFVNTTAERHRYSAFNVTVQSQNYASISNLYFTNNLFEGVNYTEATIPDGQTESNAMLYPCPIYMSVVPARLFIERNTFNHIGLLRFSGTAPRNGIVELNLVKPSAIDQNYFVHLQHNVISDSRINGSVTAWFLFSFGTSATTGKPQLVSTCNTFECSNTTNFAYAYGTNFDASTQMHQAGDVTVAPFK